MKNIFNKFAFFIALSFVFISCGNLTTSENDDSIPQGKGKITISTDLQNGRSVLPTAIDETTTGLKWELTGIKDGETTSNVIKYWTDGNSGTAYQSMTYDSGIVIDTGTWDFTLTASNTDGKNVLSATISATINAGENKLNFVMQEATENAASGSIEFTLNFPKEVVGNVVATLYKYDNDNNVVDTNRQLAINNSSNDFDSVKYSYPDSAGTTSTDLTAGYYILKIELQQKKGDTTEDFKTINTYSCLIRVAPGLLSQGKYTLPDLAQLYTINYKLEGGKFIDSATTTSYNAYTSFALPEPTKEGYDFAGWYTQDYTGSITENLFGNAGETQTINADTTLYAKWKISWDGLKNQIENASGISEFVITENLTATSTITVSKPFKITSDKNVTITRGNSIDGAIFTDAFFKVESAGNLELEGKENSTITLDGGNANESPILATAPLITSSGNLTLTNCTLQNNKNTSTTPGGAIYISAGKFTMNGGIIGEEITESDASTEKQSWQDAATETNHSNYAYAGGGGIYVASGDVTINGGKISYNYTRNPETDCQGKTPENTAAGGGISIVSGSLSLINSEVSYNSGYQGGGIRCYNDNTSNAGTLTLNKTLIKGNTSNPYKGSSFGGGLMVKNFKVTFEETTESTIEQNYSGDGGALFLENTTSTLTNITIQNNSYNPNGYHYGSEVLLWANANVSIDDSNVKIASTEGETRGIFINNNTNTLKLSGGAKLDAPVYLMSGTTVTVAGYLSSNATPVATITPEKYEEDTPVITAADSSIYLEDQVGKFTLTPSADGIDYEIDESGKLAKINTELNLDTELSNINANASGVKQLPSGVYYLEGNLELDAPVYISSGDVVIYAKNNATISGNINNDCFFVVSNCSLTFGKDELTDATLTINAEKKSDASAVLNAISSGTLNLKNNVICTGATKQSFITTANGTVNISGGKIKENHGASPIINVTGGTVNITGGEISNNSCINMLDDCPAILVSSGTLNIDGSTITISNNTYGISSDTLENQGASIYNEGGTVTILGIELEQGKKFTQNIVNGVKEDVQNSGGGIALEGTEVKTFESLQAAINGNDEVIIIASNITITECLNIERAVTIAANTDVTVIDYSYYDGYDNAFYVKDGGKLTLGGGSGVLTFKQNPSKNVASIATVSSNATIEININNNVKFTDNSYYWISMNAGNGACLNITGGEFSNNSKVPIYLNNASVNCHMSGGVISNNTDTVTCAGIYVNKGNLTITGGDITNNTVTGNSSLSGSSIRVPSTSNGSVIVNGETLTANTTYTTNIIDGKPQE